MGEGDRKVLCSCYGEDHFKMKNLVSIFAGHDANISFYNAEKDSYHTIEIERLVQKRYFRLHEDNSHLEQRAILEECRDCLLYTSPSPRDS